MRPSKDVCEDWGYRLVILVPHIYYLWYVLSADDVDPHHTFKKKLLFCIDMQVEKIGKWDEMNMLDCAQVVSSSSSVDPASNLGGTM